MGLYVASPVGGAGFAQPADNYLLGWTDPLELFSSTFTPTAGEVYLQKIRIAQAGTINNLFFFMVTVGAGMTAGQNWVGLYDINGNQLAVSADASALWTSGGGQVVKVPLVAGYAVSAGQIIFTAEVWNATTVPHLLGAAQGYGFAPNMGNGVANWASVVGPYNNAPNRFRYMSWSTAVTTLPGSINMLFANPDQAVPVGVAA